MSNHKTIGIRPGVRAKVLFAPNPEASTFPLQVEECGRLIRVGRPNIKLLLQLEVQDGVEDEHGMVIFKKTAKGIELIERRANPAFSRYTERVQLTRHHDLTDVYPYTNAIMFSYVEGGVLTVHVVCVVIQDGVAYIQHGICYEEHAAYTSGGGEAGGFQIGENLSVLDKLVFKPDEGVQSEAVPTASAKDSKKGFWFPRMQTRKDGLDKTFGWLFENPLMHRIFDRHKLPTTEEFWREPEYENWRKYVEPPKLEKFDDESEEVFIVAGSLFRQFWIGIDTDGNQVRLNADQIRVFTHPAFLVQGEVVRAMVKSVKGDRRYGSFKLGAFNVHPVNRGGYRNELRRLQGRSRERNDKRRPRKDGRK